jgi:hypothetical protein
MNTKIIAGLAVLSLLSGCATQPAAPQPASKPVQSGKTVKPAKRPEPVPTQPLRNVSGLEKVIGKDARTLVGLFGPAVQDVREQGARKLQFGGAGCILDAYLYPPSAGREPVVTYVDARLPDGRDTDRAACIMTLSRGR